MATEPRHFGPYTLDLTKGELLRSNARVPLQPQPLRLLILLTDEPGKLVTRDHIRDIIWGKDTFVEFEHALSYAISQVRYALRDSATSPRYIRTEPRRGYRFIAPVLTNPVLTSPVLTDPRQATPASNLPLPAAEPISAPNEPIAHPAEPPLPLTQEALPLQPSPDQALAAPAPGRHALLWAGALAAVLLLALAAYFSRPHSPAAHPPESTSIVVLPVVNLTGDAACEYLADSLTDELIARLAFLSENRLRVTARTSSMFYKGKSVTAATVGRELNTAYILESTLRLEPVPGAPALTGGPIPQATRLRLTTQLIRTADDTHLWTRISDTSSAQLFSTTGTLASSILAALPLRPILNNPGAYVSPSPQAQQAFIRGQHFFSLRTRESLGAALESFQAATAADPAYAEAYARLAATYLIAGSYSIMPQKQAAALAEPAIERALAIDPTLPDAYAARGHLRWFYQWNWAAGEQDFLNAIHRDANNVDALHWYALSLATSRRGPEAEEWMRRALVVDPKSLILRANLGVIQAINGNPLQGAETIEAELRENPSFFSGSIKLWGIYSGLHRDDEAYRQLRTVYNAGGAIQEAEQMDDVYKRKGYRAAVTLWRTRPGDLGVLVESEIALAAGERETAIQIILHGYQAHDGWMVYVFTDPALRPLQDDPRLKPIMQALSPTIPAGLT